MPLEIVDSNWNNLQLATSSTERWYLAIAPSAMMDTPPLSGSSSVRNENPSGKMPIAPHAQVD